MNSPLEKSPFSKMWCQSQYNVVKMMCFVKYRKSDQNNFMQLEAKIWNSIPLTIKTKPFLQFKNFTMIIC